VLESQFSWPATLEDARQWLRQLSNRAERKTIFCIDSPKLSNSTFRGELDELTSKHFGKQLIVVLAVDENDVKNLVMTENLREQSKLGKKSVEVAVGNFDDDEFKDATRTLDELGGRLVYGAQFAQELRAPWVLRTLAAAVMFSRKSDDFLSVLPPMLGREMLHIADRRFQSLGDARESFARLAKLYVDSCESKSSAIDMLASIYMFSIPKELAKERMDRQDLNELVQIGLVRKSKAPSGKPVFAIRAPELFGHEISQVLAKRLAKRLQRDADGATSWFVRVCSRMPLGDSIGAQAIYRLLQDDKIVMAIDLINRLFARPPVRENIPPGSEMMILDPDVGLMHFHVDENGALRLRHGSVISEPIPIEDGDDEMVRFASFDPWMILSQLRAYGLLLESEEGHQVNLASTLVFSLASCPVILRKPGKAIDELHSHTFDDVEVSCYSNGMIEPVTWSIAELFSNTTIMGVDRDEWVSQAVASDSYPLINRMAQALNHVSQLEGHSEWAQRMLDDHCLPALRAQPFFHS
jgi:hypothetical protein